jgi:RNA polymerase sigma-70 factor, ECF subfamily
MDPSPGDITQLLLDLRRGSPEAHAKLAPLVYSQLRRLAAHYMKQERPGHTLQPTALVNEAYLRLIAWQDANWQDRVHFFRVAARLMRQILVESARARSAGKRGGSIQKIALDEALEFSPERSGELIALDDALQGLERLDPRQAQIVELRFFVGLSVEETAEALSISARTVQRDWNVARAWLRGELTERGARPK